MIDTLKVYTHDFAIKDKASLIIQNTFDYATGDYHEVELFRDGNNHPVMGAKAYSNNDRYNLTIKGMPNGGVTCFIQMSLPKVSKGENYYPLTDQETNEVYSWLQTDLNQNGIGMNLGGCNISRLDTFRNVSGREAFSTYTPLFQLLRAKRQNRRDYGTTFTWENTRREVCVYDKLAEMQNRGLAVNHYPANSMRFEYRLKNADVCAKEIGIKTFEEVVNNLDAVREVYNEALEKYLFPFEVAQIEVLTGEMLERTMRAYQEKGRNWLSLYYRDYGAYMTSKMAGVETIKAVVNKLSGGDRKKVYRAVKLTEDMRRNYELVADRGEHKTLAELYLELKEAVLDG